MPQIVNKIHDLVGHVSRPEERKQCTKVHSPLPHLLSLNSKRRTEVEPYTSTASTDWGQEIDLEFAESSQREHQPETNLERSVVVDRRP